MGYGSAPITKADIDVILGYDVDAHEGRHASGGDDAIDAGDLAAGADPRSSSHASRHASGGDDQVAPGAIGAVATSGDEEIAGVKSFTSIPKGPTGTDPTNDDELARKGYIDPLAASQWQQNFSVHEESADPLSSISFSTEDMQIITRDASDEWWIYSDPLETFGWEHPIRLIARLHRDVNATYTPEIWIVLCDTNDPSGNAATPKFGFRHYQNQLYAVASDGTQTLLAIGAAGKCSEPTWVEARYINSSRIEFYIDGELVYVETANVPSAGQSTSPYLTITAKGCSGQNNTPRTAHVRRPVILPGIEKIALSEVPASGEWSGLYRWGTAGENLALYDVCYRNSNGDMRKAKADAAATMPGLYMALEAITSGSSGKFLCVGFITNSGWSWTVGADLMVSDTTSGEMTETTPADSGEQVQRVAMAESATTIYFKPDMTVIQVT